MDYLPLREVNYLIGILQMMNHILTTHHVIKKENNEGRGKIFEMVHDTLELHYEVSTKAANAEGLMGMM